MRFSIVIAAGALALAAPAQAATNLVDNGGFETGDFTGWTQFGDTSLSAVGEVFADGTEPVAGTYQAFFGPLELGGIRQDIETVAGRFYNVRFALSSRGGGPAAFVADVGGVTGFSLSQTAADGAFGYGFRQFNFQAIGDLTTLSFSFRDEPSFLLLDAVSVTETSALDPVPEPATWALMIAGFFGLGTALRSHRRAAA